MIGQDGFKQEVNMTGKDQNLLAEACMIGQNLFATCFFLESNLLLFHHLACTLIHTLWWVCLERNVIVLEKKKLALVYTSVSPSNHPYMLLSSYFPWLYRQTCREWQPKNMQISCNFMIAQGTLKLHIYWIHDGLNNFKTATISIIHSQPPTGTHRALCKQHAEIRSNIVGAC